MTLPRLEPINLMASNTYSNSSKINPLYGGKDKLSLQEVLYQVDLPYPVSSTQLGIDNQGRYITLEGFLVEAALPLVVVKSIELTIGKDEPLLIVANNIKASNDTLYLNILSGGRECRLINDQLYTRSALVPGLSEYPVSIITYLKLEEGLWWQH